jgi:hypothetical protein
LKRSWSSLGIRLSKERQDLLSYAFFRWESAAILAVTLILVVFVPDPFGGNVALWRWWIWIALGLLAELLIVGTTLADPDVRARLASERIRERLDPEAILDGGLRERLVQVLDTREQMEAIVQRARDERLGASLRALAEDVTNWIAALYALARRVDEYRSDAALHQRRRAVATAIQTLERQLAGTAGARARADLERTLAARRSEWARLERLDQLVDGAVSQLDESRDALQKIYTQMQLSVAGGAAKGRRSGPFLGQLRDEIAEQVRALSETGQEIAETHQQLLERA